MIRLIVVAMLTGILLVSGCRTLVPEKGTSPVMNLPETFFNSMDAGNTVKTDVGKNGWFSFNSDELNALIDEALTHNFDLNTLRTKIAQQEAQLKKKEAGFFPDLGFSFGGKKKATQVKKSSSQSSTYDGSHSWDVSLSSSYTADIWGGIEAGKTSQGLTLAAARLDVKASKLKVSSQVAQAWIDIIATRKEKQILDQQIKINHTLLDLQKLRFANGKANALEVSQQREALAEASSQGPLLTKKAQLLLNSLAFLSGKTAIGSMNVTARELPEPVWPQRVGIPADLLINRPDIQAALMRLQSSEWDITQAKADLLPSFSLTAQALFSSGKLDLLFRNWVASLAASLAGPIFDAGLGQAEVDRLKAVAREQVNLYAKTVSAAIREVEDSLVTIEKQKDYIRLLEEELAVARLTLKDAMIQYRNGKSSYLSYLVAWTSIERLERQLVGERAVYLKERVTLSAALGRQSGTDQ
ncbi:MAG: efflux transporter outer membrane subunit [Pseudomonadota bacterium]